MDFAARELRKYGWKEGQGLGKSSSGITEAIKPSIKNDLNGFGFDPSDDKSFNWWEYTFNKAAANLVVMETENGPAVKKKSKSNVQISTSRPRKKKTPKEIIHGHFCKEQISVEKEDSESSRIVEGETECDKFVSQITDEELLQICGGRTIHKGARYGLQLKGKLSRLARQESVAKSSNCKHLNYSHVTIGKHKKSKKKNKE